MHSPTFTKQLEDYYIDIRFGGAFNIIVIGNKIGESRSNPGRDRISFHT